jgi:hypothetical protein
MQFVGRDIWLRRSRNSACDHKADEVALATRFPWTLSMSQKMMRKSPDAMKTA